MVEQGKKSTEETGGIRYLSGHLDSAFDLASGGMGIHLHAVADFTARRELAEWAGPSLSRPNSNFLGNPYVFGWQEKFPKYYKEYGPKIKSPNSDAHLKLFEVMEDEYGRLKWVQVRLLLGGEEALSITNPETPITNQEELTSLLVMADKRELLKYNPRTSPQIKVPLSEFELMVSLIKSGLEISEDLWKQWDVIWSLERFREATLRAAVHKLGCMLALTEQLTYEAKAFGVPVSAEFRPTTLTEKYLANWQKLFGEPMPGIKGLYEQAHTVLVNTTKSEDNDLLGHILPLQELPYFAP